VKHCKHKAEEVLRGWTTIKYAKGIGDSLQVLGELAYMQNDLEGALEIFITRLCVYPYDNYPSTRHVWQEVHNVQAEVVRQEGRQFYQEMLHRIQQVAAHHQGYFSYLDHLAVDRSSDMARVFGRLQMPSP
jgi:hypothetical protein